MVILPPREGQLEFQAGLKRDSLFGHGRTKQSETFKISVLGLVVVDLSRFLHVAVRRTSVQMRLSTRIPAMPPARCVCDRT